jgi:hypothetical protein
MANHDPFGALQPLSFASAFLYSLPSLERNGVAIVSHLPFSIKILLESELRWLPLCILAGKSAILAHPETGLPSVCIYRVLKSSLQKVTKESTSVI